MRAVGFTAYLAVLGVAAVVAVGLLVFGRSSPPRLASTAHSAGPSVSAAAASHGTSTTVAPSTTAPASSTTVAPSTTAPTSSTTAAPATSSTTAAPKTAAATGSTTTAPANTVLLPVAAGSGKGCTAGITEGNQWIRYTVQPGDNLSEIASCFDLNGYQTLYRDNISVLGPNPNLIFPGQVITIVNGKMTVTPAK